MPDHVQMFVNGKCVFDSETNHTNTPDQSITNLLSRMKQAAIEVLED